MHIDTSADVVGDHGDHFADLEAVRRIRDVEMPVLLVELEELGVRGLDNEAVAGLRPGRKKVRRKRF